MDEAINAIIEQIRVSEELATQDEAVKLFDEIYRLNVPLQEVALFCEAPEEFCDGDDPETDAGDFADVCNILRLTTNEGASFLGILITDGSNTMSSPIDGALPFHSIDELADYLIYKSEEWYKWIFISPTHDPDSKPIFAQLVAKIGDREFEEMRAL